MAIRSRVLAFGAAVLLAPLAAGCGGDGPLGPGTFFGRDVVARPGGGVLVIGWANSRPHPDSGHCTGRLAVLALTSAGRRDPRYGKAGVSSVRLSGGDCLGEVEQVAGDGAGRAAIAVTIDRPGDCGDAGCSAHIPAAFLLGPRGTLTKVPGTEHDGSGSIALEPSGGLALLGLRVFSIPAFGPPGPVRQTDTRVLESFKRDIAVTPDGRVLALGLASNRPGEGRTAIERFLPDLRPDRSWGTAGLARVKVDPSRRRVVYEPFPLALLSTPSGGAIALVSPVTKRHAYGVLLALDASGHLDRHFGDGGRLVPPIRSRDRQAVALAGAPGGRLYITTATGRRRCRRAIMALGPDGRPERRFGHDGVATLAAPCGATKLAVARDGSLIVLVRAPPNSDIDRLFKPRADGTPDPAFGRRGTRSVPSLTVAR